MNITIDARSLALYPVGGVGFTGATELMVHRIARGLVDQAFLVSVVTRDLVAPDIRDGVWYWPPEGFPHNCDALLAMHNLAHIHDYNAPVLVLVSNGPDPYMGPGGAWADMVDAFVCFSNTHVDMLVEVNPQVAREKCHAIGLGVDWPNYDLMAGHPRVKGRMLWASDPVRGLWHMLDIFEHLKRAVPEASLHVAYDFAAQFGRHQWNANSVAEDLWECHRRLENMAGVVNLGGLLHEQMMAEQLECHVFTYPCDPPTPGSELFCLAAMECGAAGRPLVLSATEVFPEIYRGHAEILPVPGTYVPEAERRYDAADWAEVVAQLMADEKKWAEAAERACTLALRHSWPKVVKQWDDLLKMLMDGGRTCPTAPFTALSTSTT